MIGGYDEDRLCHFPCFACGETEDVPLFELELPGVGAE